MMNKDRVRDLVVSSIAVQLCVDEEEILSNMDTELDDYFACDSMDIMDIVLSIEQGFHVEFGNEDIKKLHTARDIVAYVELRLEEQKK